MISQSACLPRSATDQLGTPGSARPAASYTIRWGTIYIGKDTETDDTTQARNLTFPMPALRAKVAGSGLSRMVATAGADQTR